MIKRVFSIILAVILTATYLVSCGSDENIIEEKTHTNNNESLIDPVLDEIDEYVDELAAEYNFDGRSFTWIGSGGEAPEKEEETGDIENDALYHRQRDIEDKFGIDWTNYTSQSVDDSGIHPTIENVLRDVMAGTNAYDAGYGTALGVTQSLLLNGALVDVSDYDVIDLTRQWWPQRLQDTYNICGSIFFLNGPVVSSNYMDTYCVMFNKQVAVDYSIDGLYSIVKSGEWTFDKMFEIASVIPSNENGSGAYRYAQPNGMAILHANGETLTKFDEMGRPYVSSEYSAELSDICDKMSAVFGDDAQCVNRKGELTAKFEDLSKKYEYGSFGEMFINNKVLFYFGTTQESAELRREEVEFGILPMPKKDVEQDNYISYAKNWFNVFVPKSTKDEKVTDVIVEVMAALGLKYIKPAYYDNILKSRSTYDIDSREMIDLILETKTYDMIDYFAPDGSQNDDSHFVNIIKSAIQESSNGTASRYKMQARVVNNNITALLADLESDKK